MMKIKTAEVIWENTGILENTCLKCIKLWEWMVKILQKRLNFSKTECWGSSRTKVEKFSIRINGKKCNCIEKTPPKLLRNKMIMAKIFIQWVTRSNIAAYGELLEFLSLQGSYSQKCESDIWDKTISWKPARFTTFLCIHCLCEVKVWDLNQAELIISVGIHTNNEKSWNYEIKSHDFKIQFRQFSHVLLLFYFIFVTFYLFNLDFLFHIFDFINLKNGHTMEVEIDLPLNTALTELLAWLHGHYLVRWPHQGLTRPHSIS